jgi:hypothetical protein
VSGGNGVRGNGVRYRFLWEETVSEETVSRGNGVRYRFLWEETVSEETVSGPFSLQGGKRCQVPGGNGVRYRFFVPIRIGKHLTQSRAPKKRYLIPFPPDTVSSPSFPPFPRDTVSLSSAQETGPDTVSRPTPLPFPPDTVSSRFRFTSRRHHRMLDFQCQDLCSEW